jgi:HEAT repeat protein
MNTDHQINEYVRDLYSLDQKVRLNAINRLGDLGDELCLKELRQQLKVVNEELQTLIIAVGKLKRKLGIK